MTTPPALLEHLAAARAELLAALHEIGQEEFIRRPTGEPTEGDERWPVRDVLWHVGLYEDAVRRWVDATRRGVTAEPYVARRRPAHLNTPELLHAWLEQTRRPTVVLIEKLTDADLAAPRTDADGRETSFALALAALAEHDRAHAAQVRALRAAAEDPGAGSTDTR